MQRILAAAALAACAASSAEASIFTYANQSMLVGVSPGGVGDESSFSGIAPWYGSRTAAQPGVFQFASLGSTLAGNQMSFNGKVVVNAIPSGFGGYDAYAEYRLDFVVTQDAVATMYFDLGRDIAQGSIMALAVAGPSGSVWVRSGPDTTIFSATLVAGQYAIVGTIRNVAPSAGNYQNEAWMTGSITAVPVPAPGVIAGLAVAGLARSRRRR